MRNGLLGDGSDWSSGEDSASRKKIKELLTRRINSQPLSCKMPVQCSAIRQEITQHG